MSETRPIESLRNLGPISAAWLREIGIETIEELERLGPVVAFRLVKQRQKGATLNLLWALAAGIRDQDWRQLSEQTKRQLKRDAELD